MSSVMSSHVSLLKATFQYIGARKGLIAATLSVLYILKKLAPLTRSRHSVFYEKDEKNRHPPDPSIFPQYFLNRQGLWLRCYSWEVNDPKAVVFIIHGYGEHLGRYEHVRLLLNKEGYSVFGIDQQGFGQSEGDRGYIEKFDDYVNDNLEYFRHVQTNVFHNKRIRCFLLGHSMGGLIALHTARASPNAELWPWIGVILSGPLLVPDPKVATPILKFMAHVLSNILPKLRPTKIESSAVSRIPCVIQNYDNDPLVSKQGVCVRWGHEAIKAMEDLKNNVSSIEFPFLILQGTADSLVIPEAARQFFNDASSKDKKVLFYKNHFHEVFNDIDKEQVFNDMKAWMQEKVGD